MRFYIDDKCISMDVGKVSERLQNWYKVNKHYGYSIETEKGKIDFSPKSVARIALKVAMTPIAIPMLKMIYKIRNKEPRKHEKHEDLLDYIVLASIDFLSLFNEDVVYVKTIESSDSNERTVSSIFAIVPGNTIDETPQKEIEEGGSGGSPYVRGGEDGDGKNEIDKGDYQQENRSTALVKRV